MGDLIERPDRLRLLRFSELVSQAPSPWLVEGVLRETSVAMLYGKRGCYKSFLSLGLAGSVATGVSWHEHPVRNAGLVVYVAAEGGGGMVQRARAWSEQQDISPSAINMRFVTEPMLCLPDSDDMNILVDRIREAIGWCPEGTVDEDTGYHYEHPMAREWPQLIVIDTLARCFYGDENKQEDMGAFIQGIDRLKMEFNCALLILHHSGLAGDRERGSTVLGGACDTIYRLDAEEAPLTGLVLSCEKMKDSREPDDIVLVRREVQVTGRPTDDPNEDLTSVVIDAADLDQAEKKAALVKILELQGPLGWVPWQQASGLPKTTFQRLIVELRKTGEIAKENGMWVLV